MPCGWSIEYADCIPAEEQDSSTKKKKIAQDITLKMMVRLEIWGMWSSLLQPLLPGPL